ncbi:MAG TPA: S8 family serine peptidase [Nocardioides sp.]|nr:S8 family serine peptidase [Nocardioides sp.]
MSPLRTRLAALTCAATVVLASGPVSGTAQAQVPTPSRVGLDRLLASGAGSARGIATFSTVPTDAQVSALRDLGLAVQPMQELPLALVQGSVPALTKAVSSGTADDVYPDERLQYLDTASSNVVSSSLGAAERLRAQGFTGKGVTVGIVDSGCDGTHPDLADHIKHNVTLVSAEYANQQPNEGNTLVVPVDQGPFNNTDIGSGHGTHVAGIIAADGHTGKNHLGVAPDAQLACFAIGAVLTTTAVVTAYDYMMRQPKMLGIDVINNSWGNSFRQYDPRDPVNVATRAVTDRGATVVFSAGNSGAENAEASVSPFNQAPWVISVAASTVKRVRGDFSSNGIQFDNLQAKRIGTGGHTVALGDRNGLTWPDISAPGVSISSSCDTTGTVIGPCPPGENDTASGTSMSSPHIAGAAAVVTQANPSLSPARIQNALTATASAVFDGKGNRVPQWQVGYGHVNLDRAVALVRGPGWSTDLRQASRRAEQRMLRADAWRVSRSDSWQYDAPPATLGGSDSASYAVHVERGVDRMKVVLVYPSPGTVTNAASYTATVSRNGKQVGTTTTDINYATGVATLLLKNVSAGKYQVDVSGDYAVSDPDTIDSDSVNGRVVYLQVAQLRHR